MRAYYVSDEDNETAVVVVANNSREAKKLAYSHILQCGCEYTEIRVRWLRNANLVDLKKGVISNNLDALRKGFIDYVKYETCPTCKTKNTTVYYDEKAGYSCDACEDE